MKTEPWFAYPDIVPCLVLPFEKTCVRGALRYEALCFAKRGKVVLFAVEHARRYGVAVLGAKGEIEESDEYRTLDMAARAFLSVETLDA